MLSEHKGVSAFLFLFGDLLEVTIDDGDSEHDTSSTSNGSHEVSENAKSSNAYSSESSCSVDVASEIPDHCFLAHSLNCHILLQQVADHIARGLTRDIDPDTREERT